MIDLFNHGPYTDLHRLNLDWILEVLRAHEEKIRALEELRAHEEKIRALEERVKELEEGGVIS